MKRRNLPVLVAFARAVDSMQQPDITIFSTNARIGSGYLPFASLRTSLDITSARYRIDGGSWVNITQGNFTDLKAAVKGVLLEKNNIKNQTIELEINSVYTFLVGVINGVRLVHSTKRGTVSKPIKPFSDLILAANDTYISTIEYRVNGGSWTAVTMDTIVSGTHNGSNNSASLVDTTKNFNNYDIRVGFDELKNNTDGGRGIITSFTGTTITATLSGGTENDFDTNDAYVVYRRMSLSELAKRVTVTFGSSGTHTVELRVTDTSSNNFVVKCFVIL